MCINCEIMNYLGNHFSAQIWFLWWKTDCGAHLRSSSELIDGCNNGYNFHHKDHTVIPNHVIRCFFVDYNSGRKWSKHSYDHMTYGTIGQPHYKFFN